MDRLRTRSELNGFFWGALFIGLGGAVACGDPSCPAGSVSVSGRCEPAATTCPEGQVLEGGRCADVDESDAGADAEVDSDGSVIDASMDSDAMVSESEDPLCDALDCGDHGACRIVGDQAQCACDKDFTGELCDACEGDLVLEGDACVTLCESEDAPYCGNNGSCVEADGAADCECVHPHAGFECGECAEGFALQSDGTCEPDCGECGEHAFCNEELMTPSCECVAGYEIEDDECVWVGDGVTGGIVGGDLAVPEAWTAQNATFDDGMVSFETAMVGGRCKLGALEQTIHMPALEDAEPLVLDIDARALCKSTDPGACPALLVDIGDTVTRLMMAGGASPVNGTLSVCLGEAAYQDEVLLRIRPGLALMGLYNAVACAPSTWPLLQEVRIRPARAGECPADGELLGSLASEQGWTRRRSSETGTARIEGNKLTVSSATNGMSTLVSVPEAGGLAMRVSSPSPGNVGVFLNGLMIANGLQTSPALICLPEWTHGSVQSIGFANASGTAEVTQLSVGYEAACRDSEFDSGFERAFDGNGWSTRGVTIASHLDGSQAWRGSGAMTAVSGAFLMPGYGEPSRRPALILRARVGSSSTTGTVQMMGGGTSINSAFTNHDVWSDREICLDRAWLGQPTSIFVIASATQSSGTPYVWVDSITPSLIEAGVCD